MLSYEMDLYIYVKMVSFVVSDGGSLAITIKEPVGVVGQIIPWNYPLLMVIACDSFHHKM